MRSNPVSFRLGNLAFTHANLPIGEDRLGNRVYIPLDTGVYIYAVYPVRFLFAPSPHALPIQGRWRLGTPPQASRPGRSGSALPACAPAVGCGAVPGTHNELLPTKWLEYISIRWLVFVSSVVLVFLAAPALSPAPGRLNSNRG